MTTGRDGGTDADRQRTPADSSRAPDEEPDAVARGWVRQGDASASDASCSCSPALRWESADIGNSANRPSGSTCTGGARTSTRSVTPIDGVLEVEMASRTEPPVSAGGRSILRTVVEALPAHSVSARPWIRRADAVPVRPNLPDHRPADHRRPRRRTTAPSGARYLGSIGRSSSHATASHRRRCHRAGARGRHLPRRLPGPDQEAQAVHGDPHRGGDRGRRDRRSRRSGSAGTSSRRSRPRTPTRRGSA